MDKDNPFVDWLNNTLHERHMKVADLARVIAVQEGEDLSTDAGTKRAKAINGNISGILLRNRALGDKYARKIADAFEIEQTELFAIAGLLNTRTGNWNRKGDTAAHGKKESSSDRKILALLDMLGYDDKERAIQILETLVKTSQSQGSRKTPKVGAGSGA